MQIDYSKRIFGLDFMRAIAIILVVFSHLFWIVPKAQGFIPELMSVAGVLGVEIFFVLSGFLIGRIVYNMFTKEDFNFKNLLYFWIRRWFRTLPNYYLALLLNSIVVLYIGLNLPKSLWQYPFFIQNFAWKMPQFFQESWSLSIEEFAYILGPFLLYLSMVFKTKTAKSKVFLLVTLVIILFFIFTKIIYNINDEVKTMQHWNSSLKAVVLYRIDAIYYGVLAAYVSIVKPVFWKRVKYISVVLAILVFFGLYLIIPFKHIFIQSHTQFWNVWYLPINSVVIMFTLPLLSQIKTAPKIILKPITYISLLSYAIYILHYSIILQLLKYYLPTEGLPRFDILVYVTVYISLTLLCSYGVYRWFEKPMTDVRDSKLILKKFN